ncbi:hypothetical protein IQ250_26950 [Pseudanabaenaceae cyanobacterium LEGE 13415]|nr:hypothetical protein [Pseudanabaenaceae cyanobacterium LEGE 13415]
MMTSSRPRLQVVQNDEIASAIATIRKHRPGLINDSMVVTSALVEYALSLESEKAQQTNYQTPYAMSIVKVGYTTSGHGLFPFLTGNFNRIAAIFAHIDDPQDELIDYVSRGEKPVYTFVLKGKGFTDFEFIHVASCGSFFEECLTLLVMDFKHKRDDIYLDVIRVDRFPMSYGQKSIYKYVPDLNEMVELFFKNADLTTLDLDWQGEADPYQGVKIFDTRYVDYSHALVGLKPSSAKAEHYAVENLVRSGILSVDREHFNLRYRCICDGWTEEKQDLDLYEIGLIFGNHFGYKAAFSPGRFLETFRDFTSINRDDSINAVIYVEAGKRIEVLPMEWRRDWFDYYIDGENHGAGWGLLSQDPNPFRLYDMKDFFPNELEQYKQKKKNPKQ